jgi:hypothetical protein
LVDLVAVTRLQVAQEEERDALNSVIQLDQLNYTLPDPPFQTSGTIIGGIPDYLYI